MKIKKIEFITKIASTRKTSLREVWGHIDAIEKALIEENKKRKALEKSISVKAIEDLNNRVFALERAYKQHIKAEHIGYDPISEPKEECICKYTVTCKEGYGCKSNCKVCNPIKEEPKQELREKIMQLLYKVPGLSWKYSRCAEELADKIMEIIGK